MLSEGGDGVLPGSSMWWNFLAWLQNPSCTVCAQPLELDSYQLRFALRLFRSVVRSQPRLNKKTFLMCQKKNAPTRPHTHPSSRRPIAESKPSLRHGAPHLFWRSPNLSLPLTGVFVVEVFHESFCYRHHVNLAPINVSNTHCLSPEISVPSLATFMVS